jgi:copper chaperone CopZ
MRVALASIAVMVWTAIVPGQVRADKVELKDTHLCCPACSKAVKETLAKVEGVTEVKTEPKEKLVTFTAKDEKVATTAIQALVAAGFFGNATKDGKELKIETTEVKKGTKADTITITDVHVCCGACKKGVSSALKDVKISYEGDGAQKTVTIKGKDLDKAEILEALRKAGYNGK